MRKLINSIRFFLIFSTARLKIYSEGHTKNDWVKADNSNPNGYRPLNEEEKAEIEEEEFEKCDTRACLLQEVEIMLYDGSFNINDLYNKDYLEGIERYYIKSIFGKKTYLKDLLKFVYETDDEWRMTGDNLIYSY